MLLLWRHQLCGLNIKIPLKFTMMSCSLWMTLKVNLLNFEWSSIICLSSMLVVNILISQFSVCTWLLSHFLICFITRVFVWLIPIGAYLMSLSTEALGNSAGPSTSSPVGERKLFSDVTRLGFASAQDSPPLRLGTGDASGQSENSRDQGTRYSLFRILDTCECIRT